jgi:hypothetical protein
MSSTFMTWEMFDPFYLKIQTNVCDIVASRRCLEVMRYRRLFIGDLGDSRVISLGTVQLKARCITFLGTWISSSAGMNTCETGCKVLWGRDTNTVTGIDLVLK